MNNKRVIIGVIFGSCFLISSCSDEEERKESLKTQKGNLEGVKLELGNPSVFMGSSFGEFIQSLHKTGQYAQMLRFSSKATRENFKDDELLNFFKKVNFSYRIKLMAMDSGVLLYRANVNATERTLRIEYAVENDTCRLVLDSLDMESPFWH